MNVAEVGKKDFVGYEEILQSIPMAIYTCNAEGYVTNYNEAAAELWGRRPEHGKELWCGCWKIYNTDGAPVLPEECPMAICLKEQRAVYGKEIIIERPDGVRRHIAPFPRPLYDDNGVMIGAVNMLTDITQRKLNEEKLNHFAAIVEYSDDAIITKTLDGIVTSWNRSAQRIFGYTADEVVGKHISKLIPADKIDEEPSILGKLKKGERVDHFETKRITKDGRVLDISLTISPLKDEHGNITGASKIARDITEYKRSQRTIAEGEERLKMAVAATKLGTWDYSPISNKLQWSDECRRIYDIPDGIQPSYQIFSSLIHPEDNHNVEEAIGNAMASAGTGDYDITFRILRYSDKEVKWIRSQGKVYLNEHKQAERFIGTVLDITEERQAKERLEHEVDARTKELKKVNDDLGKSNAELEQFAYVASHDLQEPLRKIRTFADAIKVKSDGILNEELSVYIDKMSAASGKMSKFIAGLLEYARATNVAAEFVNTDLNEVFESVLDDLDVLKEERRADIRCAVLPSVEGHSLQLKQLFYNLIYNSLKFVPVSREPVIEITSRMLDDNTVTDLGLNVNNQYCEIIFTDNGIGFKNEYSQRIFTIFQRLNSSSAYAGNGIGLSLCKKVTDSHGGLIYASGRENEGATFTVILPIRHTNTGM